jgi:hypothetical protein
MKVKLARSRILRKQQTFPQRLIDARCHRSELDRFHDRKTGHVSAEIKRCKIFEFGRHTVTANRTLRHLLNFTSLNFSPPRNGLSLVQANVQPWAPGRGCEMLIPCLLHPVWRSMSQAGNNSE